MGDPQHSAARGESHPSCHWKQATASLHPQRGSDLNKSHVFVKCMLLQDQLPGVFFQPVATPNVPQREVLERPQSLWVRISAWGGELGVLRTGMVSPP